LQAAALRRTPQRHAVLAYLAGTREHPTADQVFRAVNHADPRASRATVYNSLHALVRAGLVQELRVEGNAVRYDAAQARHHHFVCERCGGLEDVGWFDVPGLARRAASPGRRVIRYEIVFRGVCAACSRIQVKES
jgi:Fur family transcriptional regulator, peroxide stress response regulator